MISEVEGLPPVPIVEGGRLTCGTDPDRVCDKVGLLRRVFESVPVCHEPTSRKRKDLWWDTHYKRTVKNQEVSKCPVPHRRTTYFFRSTSYYVFYFTLAQFV